MTKVTYIPNEIANAAVDEHGNRKPVTRTHHIFDDVKGKNQQDINEDIYNLILSVKEGREKSKGYYDSYLSLTLNISSPEIGDWAIVKSEFDNHWYICKCVIEGYWEETDKEYTSEINLNEYPKKSELKTINGQPIYGEGDIEYEIASRSNDGLLSKEFYAQLLEIKNVTLPEIQEHLDSILLLIDDELTPETIQNIIDKYNQICEFITNLGDSEDRQILLQIITDIAELKTKVESIGILDLEEIYNDIALLGNTVEGIDNNIDLIESDVSNLGNRVQQLELNPSRDSIKHIFITQSAYDALETYEEDTLYLIIEHTSGGSRLGEDIFPLILG